MVRAVVRDWHDDEGWGVIDSVETPGGCWAHFTAIESPVIERGDGYEVSEYKVVSAGDTVELIWEQARQDGYDYRAVSVRPTPAPDAAGLFAESIRWFDDDESLGEWRCMFCEAQASALIQATRHMSRGGICSECLELFREGDTDGLMERRRVKWVEDPEETARVVHGLVSTWVEVV